MNDNDFLLIIEINYDNKKLRKEVKEIINYNYLEEESIKFFNINKKKNECLEFTYLDVDGDINILSKEENDIFDVAKELSDDNYLIELNLFIRKKENDNNNINILDDSFNEIIQDKKNENILQLSINNIKGEKEGIEEVKEKYNQKLKQINLFYKNKIKSIQKGIIKFINDKYNSIEKEVTKLWLDNNKNIFDTNINNTNVNLIDDKDNRKNYIIDNNNTKLYIEGTHKYQNSTLIFATDPALKDYNIIVQAKTDENNNNIHISEGDDDTNKKKIIENDFEEIGDNGNKIIE